MTKAGWIVNQNQARFKLGSRPIFIDIFALRFSDNASIHVEVKGFEETSSVSSLGAAIGQYSFYKAVL
ncbi:MAG: XisH family protein [Anaerolineae bacterium]|nr:XisH family protein [Anaerolineae bacterium]